MSKTKIYIIINIVRIEVYCMRQIIIDAIREEIDASIDATDLTSLKIDAEERRRLNNEVNYKGKSYRNQNINDLLID